MRPVYHIYDTPYGKRISYQTAHGSTVTSHFDESAFYNRRDIDRGQVQSVIANLGEGKTPSRDVILARALGCPDRVARMSQDYIDYLFD